MHLPEPHTKKHRLKRLSKALVLAISAGAYVGSSNAVLAQEPSQTQSAELNIPDGTLNDVLKRIARQFNVNIIATTSLIDGITVSGLRGQYKVDNAIQTVLNETDLVVSRDESGAYLIGPQTTLDSKTRQIQPDKPKDIEVIDVFGTRYRPEKVSDTVSRTSIDLKELPNSVTVVTADSISDQNALTTEEVLGAVAGVSPQNNGRTFSNRLVLRGVTNGGGLSLTFRENGLAGGVNYASDPYVYERYEVIKGPSSIIGGVITPGGIINRVNKLATDGDFGHVESSISDYGQVRLRADVNRDLDDQGQFSGRVVVASAFGDEFYDFAENDYFQVVPSIKAHLSEDTVVNLHAVLFEQDKIPFWGLPMNFVGDFVVRDPAYNLRNEGTEFDATHREIGGSLVHDFLDDLTLTARFASSDTEIETNQIYAYSYNREFGLELNNEVYVYAGSGIDDESRLSADIFLTKSFEMNGGDGAITGGIEYLDAEGDFGLDFQLLGFQNLLDDTTSYSFPDELVENNFDDSTTGAELLGFYLQSVLRPIQGLTLSTGIRLDDYKATSVGFLDTNEIDAATDTEEFTWRLGLSYEIDSIATNLYASLATGFTPNLRAVTASGEFVEPETSKQAELGFKTDFADGDVLLTVAAYRLIQEDVAVEDPDNRAFSVNGGEVTSDGLEIELAGEPLPGMNFSFGIAFMDPETTSSNGVFGLMEGEQPIGTTSLNAGGLISYTIGNGRLKGLRVGGSIRHLGERETGSPLPDSDLEGFTVANVFFEYAFRGVDIGLFINNITDELYVESSNLPNNTYFGFERNVTLRVGASF